MPTPMTAAPAHWLVAALRLMMRPPSMTVTMRLTRRWAMPGSHWTSANCTPKECMEYFSALGLPVDLPCPRALAMWAVRRMSPNGVPEDAGWDLAWMRPSVTVRVLASWPLKGELGAWTAMASTFFTAASTPSTMEGMTLAVAVEPPDMGPGGRELSPRMTSTLSTGMPVLSETTCAMTV